MNSLLSVCIVISVTTTTTSTTTTTTTTTTTPEPITIRFETEPQPGVLPTTTGNYEALNRWPDGVYFGPNGERSVNTQTYMYTNVSLICADVT